MKFILLFTLFAVGQQLSAQDNWFLSARAVPLPSVDCKYEVYYSANVKTEKHYYKKETLDCFPKRHKKGIKSTKGVGLKSYSFLKEHYQDSTYWLPFNTFDTSAIDMAYMRSRNMVNDSSLLINFPLFERQYYKRDTSEFFVPFRGHQIDGLRVIFFLVENNDTLLNLNIGIDEMSQIDTFNQWILFSEAYHKFGLFEKLYLDSLFDKVSMTAEIKAYVKALKK